MGMLTLRRRCEPAKERMNETMSLYGSHMN